MVDSPPQNPVLGHEILTILHREVEKFHKFHEERPITLMHVCGTHEYTIAKHGLRSLLPSKLRVIAGPGCPVCVCPQHQIDQAIELTHRSGLILTTFGDMMRVPGKTTTLADRRATGADVRIVYSPHEAIEIALQHPQKEVVFFAIGFETTAPLIAYEILQTPPSNFSIICAHKLVPPALDFLLTAADRQIDGFLLPGHVSAIIGERPYKRFIQQYRIPMVIGGFEVNDVLISLLMLVRQLNRNQPSVENSYSRIVKREGNLTALSYMNQALDPCDSLWRGIGEIPQSGYTLKSEFHQFDAVSKFALYIDSNVQMPKGCACDLVLLGRIMPDECSLFNQSCTPQHPIGPCMVSHEGACKIATLFHQVK